MTDTGTYTYFEEQDEPGLYLVKPERPDISCTCDIILVHGLNGGPTKTWLYDDGYGTRSIWFRDLLPPFLVNEVLQTNARIWTFGYNAKVVFSASRSAEASDFVRQLLERVHQVRRGHESNKIIWIAHSLGGIVVKMALIESKLDDKYSSILGSTIGTIFLGTPHKGSSIAALGGLVAKIARLTLAMNTNTNLFKTLERNSHFLFEKASQFSKVSGNVRIYSFYETRETNGVLVVNRDSACMGLSNETTVPMDVNHRDMVRFRDDNSFYLLKNIIRELTLLTANATDLTFTSRANTAQVIVPPGHIRCRINSTEGRIVFDKILPQTTTIEELCIKWIPEQSTDHIGRTGLQRHGDEHQIPWYTNTLSATIVSSESSFTPEDAQISENEPFIVFFSKLLSNRKPSLKITPFFQNGMGISFENEIPSIPSVNVDGCLNISFHRTIRLPDDGATYPLPPSLGAFPLLNVKIFEDKLPRDSAEKGGVFIPMYQREAMWINFHVYGPRPVEGMAALVRYAIRPFLGGVNAISGEPMRPNMATLLKKQNKVQRQQDYVVVKGGDFLGNVAGQRWLDGIAVAPDVVRQFVAVPLGSKESVEYQTTGSDGVGGLQLEIIPQYELGRFDLCMRDCEPFVFPQNDRYRQSHKYPDLKGFESAQDFGIPPGKRVHALERDGASRKRTLRDELDWASKENIAESLVDLTLWPPPGIGTENAASAYFSIRVENLGTRRSKSFFATASTRVDFVLDEAAHYFRDPPGMIGALMHRGRDMDRDKTLGDHDVTAVALLSYRLKLLGGGGSVATYSPLMGLGAGGRIRQKIVKDEEDPRIWAAGESCLLNVQILNSSTFKGFTGLEPPKTPITFDTYIKNRLPFFQNFAEVEATIEYGGFKKIKSLSDPLLLQADVGMSEGKKEQGRPALPGYCEACCLGLANTRLSPCSHLLCSNCFNVITQTHNGKLHDTIKQCPVCHVTKEDYEYLHRRRGPVSPGEMDEEVGEFESVVPVPDKGKRYVRGIPSWGGET